LTSDATETDSIAAIDDQATEKTASESQSDSGIVNEKQDNKDIGDMGNYDSDAKTNLYELEGPEEIFVDKLSDLEIFVLGQDKSIEFGTYTNKFQCIEMTSESEDDGIEKITRIIRSDFYEVSNPVHIKSVLFLDEEGEEADKQAFWFDADGNDLPSEHQDWTEILENMDIFLDEMD